jgi:hypothetical protein
MTRWVFALRAWRAMLRGDFDAACLVVIEARKRGVERLPGLGALDARTAHLVRAGLAAGRLLRDAPAPLPENVTPIRRSR